MLEGPLYGHLCSVETNLGFSECSMNCLINQPTMFSKTKEGCVRACMCVCFNGFFVTTLNCRWQVLWRGPLGNHQLGRTALPRPVK